MDGETNSIFSSEFVIDTSKRVNIYMSSWKDLSMCTSIWIFVKYRASIPYAEALYDTYRSSVLPALIVARLQSFLLGLYIANHTFIHTSYNIHIVR